MNTLKERTENTLRSLYGSHHGCRLTPAELKQENGRIKPSQLCDNCEEDIRVSMGLIFETKAAEPDASMTLYSNFWRFGLPITNRAQTLQQFIDSVSEHFKQRRAPPPLIGKPAMDWQLLYHDMDEKRTKHRMEWRDVAQLTGLDHTLFSKMKSNVANPGVTKFVSMCKWVEKDPMRYYVPRSIE